MMRFFQAFQYVNFFFQMADGILLPLLIAAAIRFFYAGSRLFDAVRNHPEEN